MAAGEFPGGYNTIIPLHDASGHLQVSFGRNPNSYAVNKYTAQINAKLPRGAYMEFNPLDAHRTRDMDWPVGTPRPSGYMNQQGFTQKNFECKPYSEATVLPKVSVDLADWPLVSRTTERLARQIMLNRTRKVGAVITDSANYASTHVVAASAITGVSGFLDGGTPADPRLFIALNEAALIIQGDTGVVQHGMLSILMNHKTAFRLSKSREIREYLMQQANSYQMITGEKSATFGKSALPPVLYGFPVVIEDAYVNTAIKEHATEALSTVFPDNVIMMFVREGDLEKSEGDAGYSSWTQFVYEDMTTIAREDNWNKLVEFAVEDNFDIKVTAPQTVVKITNVFS